MEKDGNIFAKHKTGTHDLAYDLLADDSLPGWMVDVQINTRGRCCCLVVILEIVLEYIALIKCPEE